MTPPPWDAATVPFPSPDPPDSSGPPVGPPPALRLTRLMLSEVRSHAHAEMRLSREARVVVVAGENGTGKTNLLEAVSLLCPGRGLRGARPSEIGRVTPEGVHPWAVAGRFEGPHGPFDVGTGTPTEGAPEEAIGRRVLRLDDAPVRSQADLARLVACVWLTPQMDRLFGEGASGRRRFLDRLAWALEPSHAREVSAHDNAMAQRNRLLAEGGGARGADPAWLDALEDAMARHGVAATAARLATVAGLNDALAGGAAGEFPAAVLALDCSVAARLSGQPALAVEDAMREALARNRGATPRPGWRRRGRTAATSRSPTRRRGCRRRCARRGSRRRCSCRWSSPTRR